MQPWLFARQSDSIADLLKNLHYETHPRLWYLILFGVSRFTANPAAAQAANFLIIGAAMTLFVWFCPMRFYIKALTVFGYYFVYEWGSTSRNYALGVLFCFAFCAAFRKREKGLLPLALLLFLASQSNLCATAIAGGLAFLFSSRPGCTR